MPIHSQRPMSGGKGNVGMFMERDPKVCAAGIPTAQPDEHVGDLMHSYKVEDQVDALMSDAIIPEPIPPYLPPLRKPIPLDMRFNGPIGQVSELVNPPDKSKFQLIVDDLKDTTYASYWKKPLGTGRDSVPMLPEGIDTLATTFGKPTAYHGRLYDIVMPKQPYPDNKPPSKYPGVQTDRNYCKPAYNPELTYGYRTYVDKRGTYAKCCVTDDKTLLGTYSPAVISSIQSDFADVKQPRMGAVLSPNDNLSMVPEGYTFGKLKPPDNVAQCLTFCDINTGVVFFRKCLKHLNTLRKSLSKRFLPTFFQTFYLDLKFFDTEKTGWLPKETVYAYCGTKLIRFDPVFIEPLLAMWQAFDGSEIECRTFVRVFNHREPSPEIPKILDIPEDCLNFSTTYNDMVKPGQMVDTRLMAGLPSGRYFDKDYPIVVDRYCKAQNICLPQELDMKACLSPSVFTLLHVSHRDMYEKREPQVVRRVFERAGEKFTDESFNAIWNDATKYHSDGWVCYETFGRALKALSGENNTADN